MLDEPLAIRGEIGLERGDNRREHTADSFTHDSTDRPLADRRTSGSVTIYVSTFQRSTTAKPKCQMFRWDPVFASPVFVSLLLSVIATKIAIAMGQIRFRRNVPVNAAANDS